MTKRRKWLQRKKQSSLWEQERAGLETSMAETRHALTQAYAGFNATTDPELVESFVYEIRALQARYSYLIRRRKALEKQAVSDAAIPAL